MEFKGGKIKKTFHNDSEIRLQELNIKELDYFTPSEVINNNPEKERIILINNLINSGVGGSIARGYKWCKDHQIDCVAVMAGDAQMDPDELESICAPVVFEGVDYVKGNRLIHGSAGYIIPKTRFVGNSILSILTKIASGYWRVSDTQTGYTAISLAALRSIKLHNIYRRYGMPNDMLVKLNISYCTIREVSIKPVYRIGEQSKMNVFKVIPSISFLLFKSFFKRLWTKYFLKDFHPLFVLYHLSFLIGIIWIPYLIKVSAILIKGQNASFETLFAFTFLGVTSIQFLLFAMWMDIQDNERLYK
jgi:glycosyltransferase involved in cell wall biosynthesis